MPRTSLTLRIAGGVAIAFGVLTVFSGGRTLLGSADMGAVVPFVLWFNTLVFSFAHQWAWKSSRVSACGRGGDGPGPYRS